MHLYIYRASYIARRLATRANKLHAVCDKNGTQSYLRFRKCLMIIHSTTISNNKNQLQAFASLKNIDSKIT